ncbi:MAG: NERD domain-containing protein [Enterococcus sp.]|nr:NERD domain-containing protein [Enterococcus sp.]
MEKLYAINPAPKHHNWSKSPFDPATATGGSHTGSLDIEGMEWFTKDWSGISEHFRVAKPLSFFKRLFGAKPSYEKTPLRGSFTDKEFGAAGNLHGAMWKFGYHAVIVGEAGEHLSEQLLRSLLVIPGTRIFHGVKFPGSKTADIDHVIVNGDKIVLVDSKNWKGGDYWWSDSKTVERYAGGRTDKFTMHLPVALDHYKNKFKGHQTRGIVLVHASNEKRQVFRNNYPVGKGERKRFRSAHHSTRVL